MTGIRTSVINYNRLSLCVLSNNEAITSTTGLLPPLCSEPITTRIVYHPSEMTLAQRESPRLHETRSMPHSLQAKGSGYIAQTRNKSRAALPDNDEITHADHTKITHHHRVPIVFPVSISQLLIPKHYARHSSRNKSSPSSPQLHPVVC